MERLQLGEWFYKKKYYDFCACSSFLQCWLMLCMSFCTPVRHIVSDVMSVYMCDWTFVGNIFLWFYSKYRLKLSLGVDDVWFLFCVSDEWLFDLRWCDTCFVCTISIAYKRTAFGVYIDCGSLSVINKENSTFPFFV